MTAAAPPLPMQPAGLWSRAAARAIDELCMLGLCALAWLAVAIPFAILVVAGQMDPFAGEGAFAALLAVSIVGLALVLVYRYEVVSTVRSGQTLGKRLSGICVVRSPDLERDIVEPSRPGASMMRWALPHVVGLVAAFAGAAAGVGALGDVGLLVGVGTGLAVWMLVYVSALFGKDRRGWHDKAAGTIVVQATDEVLERLAAHVPSPGEPSRWGRGAGERPVRASQDWSRRLPPPS